MSTLTPTWEALMARTAESLQNVTVTELILRENPAIEVEAGDFCFYIVADPGNKNYEPITMVLSEGVLGDYIAGGQDYVAGYPIWQKANGEFYEGSKSFTSLRDETENYVVNIQEFAKMDNPIAELREEMDPDTLTADGCYIWQKMLAAVPTNPVGYQWLIMNTDLEPV